MRQLATLLLTVVALPAMAEAPVAILGYTVTECTKAVIIFEFAPPVAQLMGIGLQKVLHANSAVANFAAWDTELKIKPRLTEGIEPVDVKNAVVTNLSRYFETAAVADHSTPAQKACTAPPPKPKPEEDWIWY